MTARPSRAREGTGAANRAASAEPKARDHPIPMSCWRCGTADRRRCRGRRAAASAPGRRRRRRPPTTPCRSSVRLPPSVPASPRAEAGRRCTAACRRCRRMWRCHPARRASGPAASAATKGHGRARHRWGGPAPATRRPAGSVARPRRPHLELNGRPAREAARHQPRRPRLVPTGRCGSARASATGRGAAPRRRRRAAHGRALPLDESVGGDIEQRAGRAPAGEALPTAQHGPEWIVVERHRGREARASAGAPGGRGRARRTSRRRPRRARLVGHPTEPGRGAPFLRARAPRQRHG